MNLYIFDFNNYANRTYKSAANLDSFGAALHISQNVNFNDNDGLNTSVIIGSGPNPYYANGNYLVAVYNNEIISRWFILESKRKRLGQYTLQLRRDLIADYYNEIMQADCMIKRGMVSDLNPFIYNKESITTNQIKTSEEALKDDTGSAWVVGYMARDTAETSLTLNTAIVIPDLEIASLEDWSYYKYTTQKCYTNPVTNFLFYVGNYSSVSSGDLYIDFRYNKKVVNRNITYIVRNEYNAHSVTEEDKTNILNSVNTYKSLYYTQELNIADRLALIELNNKILKAGTDYYKITTKLATTKETIDLNSDLSGEYLNTYIRNLMSQPKATLQLTFTYDTAQIALEKLAYGQYKLAIPAQDERYHLKDAPYDMFIMPYSDTLTVNNVQGNKSLAVNIASEIAKNLGTGTSAKLYDIQLLPYCPITGYTMSNNAMTIEEDAKRITWIKNADSVNILPLIWCTASSGSKLVSTRWAVEYTENKKIANQCDLYRLVSPNFNGQFEFNMAKFDNYSDYFKIDFTYLPYKPYIRVAPQFSGLYGKDFNDARGLLLGGDFSLPVVNDAWVTYQTNNKNYENIFNRQIENMEINQKYNRINNIVGSAAASLGQGLMLGSMFNPVAGIGAGLATALGGAADIYVNEQLYKEQKSYTKDTWELQLDNIKAQPNSISKTTAYTQNNKIWPILEYYTCSDQEKNAVANSIKLNGMTVNAPGKISDYIYSDWEYAGYKSRDYIEADILNINITGDSNLVYAIRQELNQGIYFKEDN